MNLVEITLAGIKKLVHPLQVKAYASFGWKPVVVEPPKQEKKGKKK